MNSQAKLTYTVRDASRATGLGRTTLYRAIANGSLRAVKHGSRTLILSEDLLAFLRDLPTMRTARGDRT